MERKVLGSLGEKLVAAFMLYKGCNILDRNWHCVGGEIDLVTEKSGKYIFVEVKTVSGSGYGMPEEKFGKMKMLRIRRAVAQYVLAHNLILEDCRVDLACVKKGKKSKLKYYQDVLELSSL